MSGFDLTSQLSYPLFARVYVGEDDDCNNHYTEEDSESENDPDSEDIDIVQDAEMLRKAMKRLCTDEKTIIKVIANRQHYQRIEIRDVYNECYERDLIEDLKSELSGKFKKAVLAAMTPKTEFLANHLHKEISGNETDEETLVEILMTNTNEELEEIKEIYQCLYENSLENDLAGEASGRFRRLLVSLCQGLRDKDPDFDEGEASEIAQALHNAGKEQWETDESVFNKILVTENVCFLGFVFDEYERLFGKSIESSIKSETSGQLKRGLLTIVQCVRSIPAYYAERLYRAMKGAGTDDKTLIRIICTRSEIDMELIKEEFENNYGKSLEHYIAKKTSGNYKNFLLALLKE